MTAKPDRRGFALREARCAAEGTPDGVCVLRAESAPADGPLAELDPCKHDADATHGDTGYSLLDEADRQGVLLRRGSGNDFDNVTAWLRYEVWEEETRVASGLVVLDYDRDEPNGPGCGYSYAATANVAVGAPPSD